MLLAQVLWLLLFVSCYCFESLHSLLVSVKIVEVAMSSHVPQTLSPCMSAIILSPLSERLAKSQGQHTTTERPHCSLSRMPKEGYQWEGGVVFTPQAKAEGKKNYIKFQTRHFLFQEHMLGCGLIPARKIDTQRPMAACSRLVKCMLCAKSLDVRSRQCRI